MDDPKVSIIMPSHNKYPLNVFSLKALEGQTFDLREVEVLFIDDASSDETQSVLKNYIPPYSFQYIQLNCNVGRSRARNLAIRKAKGKLLLFLDAEILVEPEWIANRWQLHQESERLIVSGVMVLKGLYSVMFPGFDREQKNLVASLAKDHPLFERRLESFQASPNQIKPLLTEDEILEQAFHPLTFEKPYMKKEVLQYYGDDFNGFHLPWLAFLTGNVSVQKSLIEESGLFDEHFRGYGWEDQELGYRLYKDGASIMNIQKDISYHQEHPVSTNNHTDAIRNFVYMQKKHPEVDMLALSLIHLPKGKSLKEVSDVLADYKKLCSIHPSRYEKFKESFRLMLLAISNRLSANQPVNRLKNSISRELLIQAINECRLLKSTGNYPFMTRAMQQMLAS